MTYVTDQTPDQLRAHMRRLQSTPGWHNPLDDRLFAEVLAQDAELVRLRALVTQAKRAIDYIVGCSTPQTPQQEQCWPGMVAARDALRSEV